MAGLGPIPRARAKITIRETPGRPTINRKAKRASCHRVVKCTSHLQTATYNGSEDASSPDSKSKAAGPGLTGARMYLRTNLGKVHHTSGLDAYPSLRSAQASHGNTHKSRAEDAQVSLQRSDRKYYG